jgi:hypothetical protein
MEKTEPRPINQTAIHVDADDFAAKIAEMGDDALYQRFTVSRGKSEQAGSGPVPTSEAQEVLASAETETRAPIDVSNDLLAEFSWGSPDSPTVQNWLQENNIQPGEEVIVRIMGKEGVTEQKVSTNRETFFIPVDKLVNIPTDEFEHAEIVAKKYPVGASVIVERNVYGPDGKMTGEKMPDTGWKVIGYGKRNGVPTTKVQKNEGTRVLDKEPTDAELRETQSKYGPEANRPHISESLVRKTGHQELEAAGIQEPEAGEQQLEVDESQELEATPQTSPVQAEISQVGPEVAVEVSAKEEVAKLPIEAQRAIRDYEMYMSSADISQRINGYNRDAEDDRNRASDGIKSLPTAMKELAQRYYEEQKEK